MKNIKKIGIFTICAISALSLVACGKKTTTKNVTTTNKVTTTKKQTTTKANTTKKQTTTNRVTTNHVHAFGEWETVTKATCTTDGLKKRVCACGYEETEAIPMTGHSATVNYKGECLNCDEPILYRGELNFNNHSFEVATEEDTLYCGAVYSMNLVAQEYLVRITGTKCAFLVFDSEGNAVYNTVSVGINNIFEVTEAGTYYYTFGFEEPNSTTSFTIEEVHNYDPVTSRCTHCNEVYYHGVEKEIENITTITSRGKLLSITFDATDPVISVNNQIKILNKLTDEVQYCTVLGIENSSRETCDNTSTGKFGILVPSDTTFDSTAEYALIAEFKDALDISSTEVLIGKGTFATVYLAPEGKQITVGMSVKLYDLSTGKVTSTTVTGMYDLFKHQLNEASEEGTYKLLLRGVSETDININNMIIVY